MLSSHFISDHPSDPCPRTVHTKLLYTFPRFSVPGNGAQSVVGCLFHYITRWSVDNTQLLLMTLCAYLWIDILLPCSDKPVLYILFSQGKPRNSYSYPEGPCLWKWNENQEVTGSARHYCSIASFRIKIPDVFRGIFESFAVFHNFYLLSHDFSRNSARYSAETWGSVEPSLKNFETYPDHRL